jgi:hypothetical protein
MIGASSAWTARSFLDLRAFSPSSQPGEVGRPVWAFGIEAVGAPELPIGGRSAHARSACHWQSESRPPNNVASGCSLACLPSRTASTTSGASNVRRSRRPTWARSTPSTFASSRIDPYRPSSSIRLHRKARARAFTSTGSPRVSAVTSPPNRTGAPSGPKICFRPLRRRMVIGTTTVTLVMPRLPPASPCPAPARPSLPGST